MQAMHDSEQKRLELTIEQGQTKVTIHIDDSGPGLDGNSIAELFEPFYTTKENGLGLGLSISQQIIQNLNGKIRVARSPLGGARFSVELPIFTHADKD
jgi:two-component system C4-dicarboxylate transport sensor histidine kinase DctB